MATYDPQSVIVTVFGTPISGFADGEFVKAERNSDAVATVIGADGEGTRVRSANKSGKVTITLRDASPSNDVLRGYAKLDEQRMPGGRGPVKITDMSGSTLVSAADAWITKMPGVAKGKDAVSTAWVFETFSLNILPGGNAI